MDGGIRFWMVVLWVGAGAFGLLSLCVIVAGFGDIRRMFEELRRQAAEGGGDSAGPGAP